MNSQIFLKRASELSEKAEELESVLSKGNPDWSKRKEIIGELSSIEENIALNFKMYLECSKKRDYLQ